MWTYVLFDLYLTTTEPLEKDKEKDKKLNKLVISDNVTNLTRYKSLFLLHSHIVGKCVIQNSKFNKLGKIHHDYARSM